MDFCGEWVMEQDLSFTFGCVAEAPSTLVQLRDRKGLAPEYVLYLWVGWLLQHEIIDGPACQGVLIWDGVARWMCGTCSCNHLYKV